MAALLSRQQTGKGVWIDCNLFETQVRFSVLVQDHTYLEDRSLVWPTLRQITLFRVRRPLHQDTEQHIPASSHIKCFPVGMDSS
jgi:crotonobetainyl-CoA:carnitine CoA-transferase CaiB-like acyl-CoA transferase